MRSRHLPNSAEECPLMRVAETRASTFEGVRPTRGALLAVNAYRGHSGTGRRCMGDVNGNDEHSEVSWSNEPSLPSSKRSSAPTQGRIRRAVEQGRAAARDGGTLRLHKVVHQCSGGATKVTAAAGILSDVMARPRCANCGSLASIAVRSSNGAACKA